MAVPPPLSRHTGYIGLGSAAMARAIKTRQVRSVQSTISWNYEACCLQLPKPNFNTSNLQVADLAGKNREIRDAWHHAGGGPGASVQEVG